MKEFIIENFGIILSTWIPAFLTFGNVINLSIKNLKINTNVKELEDTFNAVKTGSITNLTKLEEIPKLVEKILEDITKEFTSHLKDLQRDLIETKDLMSKEFQRKVKEIEERTHNQIVAIRKNKGDNDDVPTL